MTGETEVLSEKPVLLTLCPSQTSHELSWDRGRTSTVRLVTNHYSHSTALRRRVLSWPAVVAENGLFEKRRHRYMRDLKFFRRYGSRFKSSGMLHHVVA